MSQPTSTDETPSENSELEKALAFYWEQIERLEGRIENQEAMIAMLTQGFAEIASSIEATMEIVAEQSDEIKAKLESKLLESKKKMIGLLNINVQDPPDTD